MARDLLRPRACVVSKAGSAVVKTLEISYKSVDSSKYVVKTPIHVL